MAGADDANGGWLVSGCSGEVVLADLAASAGVAALGAPPAAPVGVAAGEPDALGLDEPDPDGEDDVGEAAPPDDAPDVPMELVGADDPPDGLDGARAPGLAG
ncbi:hypothetical protein HLY00_2078 [Mycolicibacterium hippocampi]|uniref:Uncharacterized protein n=1 Tax=Mycolicibacterium hippocampi TaxID=659824 RepID=A0A850PGG2_9MYCO|nr:hypothetical protein [Mycolicibacterium hippocampi]